MIVIKKLSIPYQLLFTLLILHPSCIKAQVLDLTSNTRVKASQTTEYNGDFLTPSPSTPNEVKVGLAGQKITILKISPISIQEIDGIKLKRETDPKGAGLALETAVKQIAGGEWTIQEFVVDDHSNTYIITNGNKTYTVMFQTTDKWFLHAGLEKLQKHMIGRSYISFRRGLKITGLDGSEFMLDGVTAITVTDVRFAKLSSEDISVVLVFDNGLIKKYDPDENDRAGWIEIGETGSNTHLVDAKTLEKYASKNSDFIEAMRSGNATQGMTEEQALLAWGRPTEIYKNMAGFDKLIIYTQSGNDRILYIKDGIVKHIK